MGLSNAAASGIVERAGSKAAAGGGSLQTFERLAPPGTPQERIVSVFHAGQSAFVHALHVGIMVAIVGMTVAAIVSAVFVRSHVEPEVPPGEAKEAIPVGA
jgi:H+/gluconate symporter-like permease